MGFTDSFSGHWDRGHSIVSDSVSYAPGVGIPVTVLGIFDNAFELVDLGQAGVSSMGPKVSLRLADLPSHPETDPAARVTYGGKTYRAHLIQDDGLGMVTLQLHEST